MKKFESVNEILDFAIVNEQDAVDFYTGYAEKLKVESKNMFLEFAQEEIKHKARLMKIKEERMFTFSPQKIQELNISDYTTNFSLNMTYQDALILAMAKEKAAFKLYIYLAAQTDVPPLKAIFLSLAQEESKHKLRFEIEYDEYILKEN
jgi:rubrerythrin